MKRILSFVLSVVTICLLCPLGYATDQSAKDFSDYSLFNPAYIDAIDYAVSNNILSGYNDGSFNPKGSLTRGAAAKFIAVSILGANTANTLSVTEAPFPDVSADNTFAGYIAYCANSGYISGYSDGTFHPEGMLIAGAFAKMLLLSIGYDTKTSGYTGSEWMENVTKDALSCGIFTGSMDFNPSNYLTREQAAFLLYNAAKYDGSISSESSESSETPTTSNTPAVATSVSLSATTQTIYVGKGVGLSATVAPSTASQSVTWSSSNRAVATVDKSGYVWGNAVGTATITATTSNGKTATCAISVQAVSSTQVPTENIISTQSISDVLSAPYTTYAQISTVTSDGGIIIPRGNNFYTAKNSANGIILNWAAENISNKTIKYISFSANFYNAVGDPVLEEISGRASKLFKITGPISPSSPLFIHSILGYSNDCTQVKITTVSIEYMDGSTVSGNYGYTAIFNENVRR